MKGNITYIFKTEKKLSELEIIYKSRLLTILFTRDCTEIIEKKITRYHPDIIKAAFTIEKISDLYIDAFRQFKLLVSFFSFSFKVNNITANLFAVFSTLRLKWINFHNLNSSTVIWKREEWKRKRKRYKFYVIKIFN